MIETIRSEFRKLVTIRSTYVLAGIAVALLGFFSFWELGFKGTPDVTPAFMAVVKEGVTVTAMFMAIIAVLHVTHEYRYNTIMYTLTASSNRTKVFLSKLLVLCGFVLAFFVVSSLIAMAMVWLGAAIKGVDSLNTQFFYWDTLWRSVFHMLAWTMLGILFGFLFRHVVGAIAMLMIVPTTVEGLLSIVLKENTKYLPYTAIEQVHTGYSLTPGTAALVASAYVIGGLAIAWFLFLKRDAN